MERDTELADALGRAREGSHRRIRELLQTSPRRAHVLLRASIRRGVMSAADPVEEHSLIMSMMMSRSSIRSALHMLGNEGLIQRRQRLGTSVVASISELPLLQLLPLPGWTSDPDDASHTDPSALHIEHLEQAEVLADRHVQGRLRIDTDRVIMQEDIVRRGGEPVGIIVGYFPLDGAVWHGTGTREARSNFLRGLELSRIEATVEAVNCDERTARVLGVAEGAAILVRETLLYDAAGVPRMLAYGHYRGDRVALRAEEDFAPVSEAGLRAKHVTPTESAA